MPDALLREHFVNGLQPDPRIFTDKPYLARLLNAKPGPGGLIPPLTGLSSVPEDLTDELAAQGITVEHPYPQYFRGRTQSFLCTATNIYLVDETTWELTRLLPISVARANAVTNGRFDYGTSSWTLGGGAAWSAQDVSVPVAGTATQSLFGVPNGTECIVVARITGTFSVQRQGGTATTITGTGNIVTATVVAGGTGTNLVLTNTGGATGRIHSVEMYTAAASFTQGSPWTFADFGPVFAFANGEAIVFTAILSSEGYPYSLTFFDTAIKPQSVCNFRGRLMIGGFKYATGADTDMLKTSLAGLWGAIAPNSTIAGLVTGMGGLTSQHVWWSSITGQDIWQWFLPDLAWELPGMELGRIEALSDPTFDDTSKWTLTGSNIVQEASELRVTAAGGSRTCTQTFDKLARHPMPGTTVKLTVSIKSFSAGTFGVAIGTASTGSIDAAIGTGPRTFYLTTPADAVDPNFVITFTSSAVVVLSDISLEVYDKPELDEVWAMGDSGDRKMPWQGDIVNVVPLGDGVAVYTKEGIAGMVPVSATFNTFGFRRVANIGISQSGAVCGTENEHRCVDRDGILWRIGGNFQPERLGFEQFLLPLSENVTVHLDESRQEWYFSGTNDDDDRYTYIHTPFGMGACVGAITALPYLAGTHCALVEAAGAGQVTGLLAETGDIDFGTRDVKTAILHEVGADCDNMEITLRTKSDRQAAFHDQGPYPLSRTGKLSRAVSGTTMRWRITNDDYATFAKLEYIKILFNTTGKRSLTSVRSMV